MRSLVLLAVFGLFSAASAVTEVEIRNHTNKQVNFGHVTNRYSTIPTDDLISLDEGIEPGKAAIVHFSFIGIRYPQFSTKIQTHEIETDGIYLTVDGKEIPITWNNYFLDLNPKELLHAEVTLEKLKGLHYVLTIHESHK